MNLLRSMQVVLAVADSKSMTGAAKQLGTSLPTIVRIVAELEASLKLRLFNRTTRQMELTQEGQIYCEHCRKIVAEVSNLEEVMAGARGVPRGQVSVTAPILFGELHAAPILAALARDHPELQVRLFLTDRYVDIVEEHFDIAVRIGQLRDSSLIARKVGEVSFVLCASPGLLKKTGAPSHPKELTRRPVIAVNAYDAGSNWHFEADGKKFAVPVTPSFVCNLGKPAINACIAGAGFGLFLTYQVKEAVAAGQLEIVLPQFQPPASPVNLLFNNSRLLTPRTRFVLDALGTGISV
jgi:DNA-binding transcriptional LysR family regulator